MSRPAELYTIVRGVTIWRLNNSVANISSEGNTFYPQEGLSRGSITDGLESLDVYLPADHAYPQAYLPSAPGTATTVTIQYIDLDDPVASLRVVYKGWVKSVGLEDDDQIAKLHLDPIVGGMDAEIPMDTFSPQCQTTIFSARCGLSSAGHTYSATVSVVAGDTITVPGLAAAKGASWAVPGIVEFGDEVRQVYSQAGDVLTLAISFYANVLDESVTVYEGCDGSIETCEAKGNVVNFRGFPYVPTSNPFATGLQ